MKKQRKWVRSGPRAMMLILGILGAVYLVMGGIFLYIMLAMDQVDLTRFDVLTEDQQGMTIVGGVFAVLGVAFLAAVLMLGLADRRRTRQEEDLRRFGSRISGVVTAVRTDARIKINRVSPMVATVRCTMPGGEKLLQSRQLWEFCPAVGDPVEVLYDPMDERKYVLTFPTVEQVDTRACF